VRASGTRCSQSAQSQFGAQALPESHSHAAPQLQSAPHEQLSSRGAHAQIALEWQDVVANSFVIGASLAVRI
jgi:hypothetical protein